MNSTSNLPLSELSGDALFSGISGCLRTGEKEGKGDGEWEGGGAGALPEIALCKLKR